MGAQRDSLLKELHQKEMRIEKLLEEAREYRSELSLAAAREAALKIELEKNASSLRETQRKLQRKEYAAKQIEKRCKARIKREAQIRGLPKDEKDRRISVLEWVVKKICAKHSLAFKEILSLSEICGEEDPLIISCIDIEKKAPEEKKTFGRSTQLSAGKKEDLIEYLDNNGVKSMLDIKIDQTDDEPD